MNEFVFDTTFIVKGLVEPRRKKQDKELTYQKALHKKAKEYMEKVEKREISMIIPSFALIETSSVISRLTNDKALSMDSVNFLWENAKQILFDYEILDTAIRVGIETKASGFDTLYISVLELVNATLLTDDLNLHKLAKRKGFNSLLLRELI